MHARGTASGKRQRTAQCALHAQAHLAPSQCLPAYCFNTICVHARESGHFHSRRAPSHNAFNGFVRAHHAAANEDGKRLS
jgi:hypothetical protein